MHKGWTSRNIESYPEKFFKHVLDNNKIAYEFNYPISKKSLGVNGCSCYFLDFKIGDKIDLEIDGKQHNYKDRHKSDLDRDFLLTRNGFLVYRISWNEIVTDKGKQLMKQKIDDFLNWYKSIGA